MLSRRDLVLRFTFISGLEYGHHDRPRRLVIVSHVIGHAFVRESTYYVYTPLTAYCDRSERLVYPDEMGGRSIDFVGI